MEAPAVTYRPEMHGIGYDAQGRYYAGTVRIDAHPSYYGVVLVAFYPAVHAHYVDLLEFPQFHRPTLCLALWYRIVVIRRVRFRYGHTER